MTDSTRVVACEEVISTDLDGEAVLMHVSKGLYLGLNAVGGPLGLAHGLLQTLIWSIAAHSDS